MKQVLILSLLCCWLAGCATSGVGVQGGKGGGTISTSIPF